MHANVKTLLCLMIPMALTLNDLDASAKKKKHKHPDDADAAAAPAQTTPAPAPAPAATTAAPTPASPPAPVVEAQVVVPAQVSPASAPVVVAAVPTFERPRDHVRFRGGVAVVGGGEFVSGFTAGLAGVDGRIGVQINNLIGIYIQPHAVLGQGSIGNVSGVTGNFAATAMIDFTFIDRIFVGAGVGGGVLNNPGGAAVQFRVGGYPVMKISHESPRRKALMLGLDTRIFIITGLPVVEMMGAIGYEAF